MIYKKEANFPYPVLSNHSMSYEQSEFNLDIELNENTSDYFFKLDYQIESDFLVKLLLQEKAQLVLVIQSKDNKFFILEKDQKEIKIPKSRISLSKKTVLQLLIQAKEAISFKENDDLGEFYNAFKSQITIQKHALLGYSNTVIFDGSNKKPLELFEKKIDPNLKSDIKIELGSETIIINYRNEELQFRSYRHSDTMNNHYIYMGLQRALIAFILNNSAEGEESVILDEMIAPEGGLDFKLYSLMKNKRVEEVSMENIDEVICQISDHILAKHTAAIKEACGNGN